MKKQDVHNETLETQEQGTPFELREAARVKHAHFVSLLVETHRLVEGLERMQQLEGTTQLLLDVFADKAIIALASEMEEQHGVTA